LTKEDYSVFLIDRRWKMKKYLIFTIVIILGFALSIFIYAGPGQERLSQPFTLTVGDWVAFKTESMIRGDVDQLTAPTYVNYDKDLKIVVVEIYGARYEVEGAKESLLMWCNYIKDKCTKYLKDFYGIEVLETDFTVIYYDRKARGGPKEIIRMEAGKLLLPQE
jgi:hypothetical protein